MVPWNNAAVSETVARGSTFEKMAAVGTVSGLVEPARPAASILPHACPVDGRGRRRRQAFSDSGLTGVVGGFAVGNR